MKRRLQLVSFVVIAVLAVSGLVWRQAIRDELQLVNYHPATAITQLAAQTTMTAAAQHLFYINHPQIDSKAQFAPACNAEQEQTIVLGCYHPVENGIFLLQVSDSRLDGVEQVTAAHETLHAAYDRLSTKERNYIDGLLMDYYQHDLTDSRIKQTIDAYRKTEPNDVVNEMHSVFGTEVANLPAPLEAYYQRYFTNRKAITDYAGRYEAEFTSRQNQVGQDDAQLTSWQAQIKSQESQLQATSQQLSAQRSQATTPAQITAYNAAVDQYNNQISALRQLISNYNQLVASRNQIAVQVNQLQQAITGTSIPQSK